MILRLVVFGKKIPPKKPSCRNWRPGWYKAKIKYWVYKTWRKINHGNQPWCRNLKENQNRLTLSLTQMILKLVAFWKKKWQKKQAAAIANLGDIRLRSNTGFIRFGGMTKKNNQAAVIGSLGYIRLRSNTGRIWFGGRLIMVNIITNDT